MNASPIIGNKQEISTNRSDGRRLMTFPSACSPSGRRKESAAHFPNPDGAERKRKKREKKKAPGLPPLPFIPRVVSIARRSALEIARFFGSLLLDSPAAFPSLSLPLLIAANGKLRTADFLVSALENSMPGRLNDYSRGGGMTTASAALIVCNESPPVLGKYVDCGYASCACGGILLDTRIHTYTHAHARTHSRRRQ